MHHGVAVMDEHGPTCAARSRLEEDKSAAESSPQPMGRSVLPRSRLLKTTASGCSSVINGPLITVITVPLITVKIAPLGSFH